jgi:hypothetical protein
MPILRNEALAVEVKCLRHKGVMIAPAPAPRILNKACAGFIIFKIFKITLFKSTRYEGMCHCKLIIARPWRARVLGNGLARLEPQEIVGKNRGAPAPPDLSMT